MHAPARGATGSPPHAWGDSLWYQCRPVIHRFTPTRVGRLGTAHAPSSNTPVHPHPRGEIVTLFRVWGWIYGSPPHAWGDYVGHPMDVFLERFTPTRVGRFAVCVSVSVSSSVHPHTRGEIRQGVPHRGPEVRFTPTRVGRLSLLPTSCRHPLVHPHTRGEIAVRLWQRDCVPGSPPHAWGDSWNRLLREEQSRFTPTRVGRLATASRIF